MNAELKIEYIPVGSLRPYDKNARKHKDADVKTIMSSIQEFGFDDPIGVWGPENLIVEGHGRLLAAKKLGMETVPVIRLDHLTDEQRRAYALAHNKTAEMSEWDDLLLSQELLDIFNIDMMAFGFDLVEKSEVVDDEYEPVIPDEPKTKIGDIYRLGRHRLMCGDSTSEENVRKLVDGNSIDMLLTDPPYNVDYEGTAGKIKNDCMESSDFRKFLTSAFKLAAGVMKDGAPFHIWFSDSEAYNFRGACADAGLVVRQQLIWVKNNATLGRQDFQHQYESVLSGEHFQIEEDGDSGFAPCLYGWTDGAAHPWYKKRKEKDVMFFDKPLASKEHPTMKPILMFDYEMKCNSRPGENILDLFAGSGTTIMAAEQNGRTAFAMEYDPKFVDVIIDRWEKFTGNKAVLINGEK